MKSGSLPDLQFEPDGMAKTSARLAGQVRSRKMRIGSLGVPAAPRCRIQYRRREEVPSVEDEGEGLQREIGSGAGRHEPPHSGFEGPHHLAKVVGIRHDHDWSPDGATDQ